MNKHIAIAIEEMEDVISEYKYQLDDGYIGDSMISYDQASEMSKAIVGLAVAIEVLKNNED